MNDEGMTEPTSRGSSARWIVAVLLVIPVVIVLGFGIYLASLSGDLPWQTDPTRIPITPFANFPTAVPDPAGTPVPGS